MLTDFNAVYDQYTRRQWSILVRDVTPASDFASGVKSIGYYLGDVLQVIDRSEVKKYQLYLTDYISTLESFFRVRRRLLLTDLYQAFDYPTFGSKGLRTLDYLKTLDSVALQKSLSPLLLSLLLQRRIPIRYATLVLTDYISVYESTQLQKSLLIMPLLNILQRRIPIRYIILSFTDYITPIDRAVYRKAQVHISEYLKEFELIILKQSQLYLQDVLDVFEFIPHAQMTVYNLWPTTDIYVSVIDYIRHYDVTTTEMKSNKVIMNDYIRHYDETITEIKSVKITVNDYIRSHESAVSSKKSVVISDIVNVLDSGTRR